MGKFSQAKLFEEEKVKELKEYEDSLQHALQTLEREYHKKIKSISEELSPHRQKVRDEYLRSLQAQSNQITRVVNAQMEKLDSYEKEIDQYATEIAKMILRDK